MKIALSESEGGGGIARTWWRNQTIHEVIRRMRVRSGDRDKSPVEDVIKIEVNYFSALLVGDIDMYVARFEFADLGNAIGLIMIIYFASPLFLLQCTISL
jgi:hypothetical protein